MADYYVGEIRIFPRNLNGLNTDFIICDGHLLSISTYQILFALLGTTWGGDGVSTFGIPNLVNTIPIGQGQGTGLTNRVIGQTVGSNSVTLTTAQLPNHTHAYNATTQAANADSPAGTVLAEGAGGYNIYVPQTTAGIVNTPLSPEAIGVTIPTAAATSHENMAPTIALAYFIATTGLYPTQS